MKLVTKALKALLDQKAARGHPVKPETKALKAQLDKKAAQGHRVKQATGEQKEPPVNRVTRVIKV